jgi:holo-[acyl-carrier protein] synthase
MIVGMGTDLVEIDRVQRSIERFGDRFLERVYTHGEILYCQSKKNFAESFAARFAAKEAGAKALGTGISWGVSWQEFEVRREPTGKPSLVLSGRAAELGQRLGVARIALSLTHTRALAMAVVVMEAPDSPATLDLSALSRIHMDDAAPSQGRGAIYAGCHVFSE